MPCAMMSLIARKLPSSSAVTICSQARLLCRYCSIDITASCRTKSASRSAAPARGLAMHRAKEIADASPLFRPRPGQKWMALAASPCRKPNVPGVVWVRENNRTENRGRCTMLSWKAVTAVRFSAGKLVESIVPTLRIAQLEERTVVASALVAALFGCTCCIMRGSAATELAASSSDLMQADADIPGHEGCTASHGPEFAPGRHAALQVACVHRICRMMRPTQLRSLRPRSEWWCRIQCMLIPWVCTQGRCRPMRVQRWSYRRLVIGCPLL